MPKPDAVMKNYGTLPGKFTSGSLVTLCFLKKYSGIMGQENTMICQKQFPITIDCCTNKAESVILSLHFDDKTSFGHTFFF